MLQVLTAEMLFPDLDNAEFNATVFVSNMASNLEVLSYQLVVTQRVPGSLRVEFEVQPPLGSTTVANVRPTPSPPHIR